MSIIQVETTSASYTYSESDTKATRTTGTDPQVVRAKRGLNSGQYYWEWDITGSGLILATHGVAQSSASITAIPGLADTLGWSAKLRGPEFGSTAGNEMVYNGSVVSTQSAAFGSITQLVIRCWYNFDTGRFIHSWSLDGTTIASTSPTWRIYWTGNLPPTYASFWDNTKVWFPYINIMSTTHAVKLRSDESNCLFGLPPGAKYLGDLSYDTGDSDPDPINPVVPSIPDTEFLAWLKTDADRVLLVEAEYSTGEPDILGITGNGMTVQSDGITALNEIGNQPGNGAKGFAYSNATITFGQKKYFEFIPKKIITELETFLGLQIAGSLTPTTNTGASGDQVGFSPDGSQLLEGVLSNCSSCYDNSITALTPRAFFKFDESTGFSAAKDSSSNNLDGLYNSATLEAAPISDTSIGSSVDFDGTSSYVEIDSLATDLNSSGIIAMVAVVNLDDTTGARQVSYIMSDVTDNTAFGVWITDGIVTVGGRSIGSDSLQTLSSAITVSAGSTALIYASVDYASGELNLSVNGEAILNSSVSFTNGSVTTQSFGRIGQANNTLPVYLDGRIDGPAFFTTNLTQVDIDVLAACVGVTASENRYVMDFGTFSATNTDFGLKSLQGVRLLDYHAGTQHLWWISVNGLSCADLSSGTPVYVATYSSFPLNSLSEIAISGDHVIGTASSRLVSVDISVPASATIDHDYLAGSGEFLLVKGNYAYVTEDSTDTLKIVDISNKSAMNVVSTTTDAGIDQAFFCVITDDENTLYLSGYSNNNLVKLDVTNKAAPVIGQNITNSEDNPGTTASLLLDGNYLYRLGGSPTQLTTYDVSTSIMKPINKKSTKVNGYNGARMMRKHGNNIIFSQGTASRAPAKAILGRFNVTDPETPQYMSALLPHAATVVESSDDFFLLGDSAWCMSKGETYCWEVDLKSNNEITTGAFRHIGTVFDADDLRLATAVTQRGNYAYVSTASTTPGTRSFTIIDVSDVHAPSIVGNIKDDTNLTSQRYVAVSEDSTAAYVTCRTNDLRVIDITNKSSPSLGTLITLGAPQGVVVKGDYLYVCDRNNDSLNIYDITTPLSPSLVGTATSATHLDLITNLVINDAGTLAFGVSSLTHRLSAVDISNKSSPTVLGSYHDIPGTYIHGPRSLDLFDNETKVVVVSTTTSGIATFDVSTPASPTPIATIQTTIETLFSNVEWDIAAIGTMAYATNKFNSGSHLVGYDISDATNIMPCNRHPFGTNTSDTRAFIDKQNKRAYISEKQSSIPTNSGGFFVMDLEPDCRFIELEEIGAGNTIFDTSRARMEGFATSVIRTDLRLPASGKIYCEFEFSNTSVTYPHGVAVGVASQQQPYDWNTGDTNCIYFYDNASTTGRLAYSSTPAGKISSGRAAIAIDVAAQIFWVRDNAGVWIDGDPVTTTGGYDFSDVDGDIYIAFGNGGVGGGDYVQVQIKPYAAQFDYAVPSGFTAYGNCSYTIPASAKKLANPEGTITLDAGETGFSQSSTSTWNAIGIKNPQVSTGKYYWEMEFNGLFLSGNIQRFMGVSTVVPGTPIGYPGSSSDNNSGNLGVGWLLHLGRVYQNGGFTSGHVSVTDSTLLRGCCAFDVDTGKFWFGTVNKSTGATIWNGTGDPATGSNPDVTLTGGTYYVSFGGFNATANGTVSTLVSLPADYLATTIPTGFGSLS